MKTYAASKKYACASANGTDWRDTSKSVLEYLEKAITQENQYNTGFLYISDALADDVVSITNLFKSVTGIQNWVGCTGIGVCANGTEYLDQPAIAALIGTFHEDETKKFPPFQNDLSIVKNDLDPWLKKNNPMLVYVHADPLGDSDALSSLHALQEYTQGFLIGGMASSRGEHVIIPGQKGDGCLSGIMFSSDCQVSTALSQGCRPIGPLRAVTKADDHVILELDGRRPYELFEEDLRAFIKTKTGLDPNEAYSRDGKSLEAGQRIAKNLPDALRDLVDGEIHIAFAVSGSDQQDYLVRNIMGVDPDEGHIAVSHFPQTGDHIVFAYRDDETIREELTKMLIGLRTRVMAERGHFAPQAGLYVSCAGRAYATASTNRPTREMDLIKEIIGDIPVAGFYASGEISNTRLYAYTGILTLFF